ncbi:MAG: S41 family peptidase [Saprospiraceae bacterium]|nr:S41 family peptidase [Saprospiraceae bacterium]
MKKQTMLLILIFHLITFMAQAQEGADHIDDSEKQEVIDSISNILESDYVYPDVALEMIALVKKKMSVGDYSDINDPDEYAQQLTSDLQSVSNDLHLRINFTPEQISQWRNASQSEEDSIAMAERRLNNNRRNNYGFQEIKILDGNVGYLDLTGFFHVDEEAGATAQAAMNYLSNADALIIDLRQNGGGSPSMIQLITSYLYGPEPVHLNSFYYRPTDERTQTWTLPYVPGKRRPDIDVYVLTSGRTFSAAEEFSYNLRNLERATLVGETTGGGAHPGGTRIATDRYMIWVPTGRAINPITDTNWEGTGVEPHIKVPAGKALETAHVEALKKMKESRSKDDQFSLQWAIDGLKAKANPIEIDADILEQYAGNYGPRMIKYENGSLFYQREGNPRYMLIPMSTDTFMIEEIPYFRIKIIKEGNNVIAIQGLYNDGRTDKNLKTSSTP